MSTKAPRFCYLPKIANEITNSQFTLSAVARKGKYWTPGQKLRIFFIGGTTSQINSMKSTIIEMLSYTETLSVEFVTDRMQSDIRISFVQGIGSYSYLGTDAKFISKSKETLNLGWAGKDVERHEFGHALNLAHEHQNPNGGIIWDEAAVIKSLSGPPNNWSLSQIRHNVLDQLPIGSVDSTAFDKKSIMLYYFEPSWTLNGVETNSNVVLSETDKQFLKSAYSFPDTIAPVVEVVGSQYITLGVGSRYTEQGATAIDNQDGDISHLVKINGAVDTSKPGLYTVEYTVNDQAGNIGSAIRQVLIKSDIVIEPVEPPVIVNDGCAGIILIFIACTLCLVAMI